MATTPQIDLSNEVPLNLVGICHRLPPGRGGVRPHPSTPLRWILRGAKTADGRVIRLAAVRVGGRWVSSVQALDRFLAELTAAALPGPTAPAPTERDERRTRRAGERAGDALAAGGW
jgi:hypothetical protein